MSVEKVKRTIDWIMNVAFGILGLACLGLTFYSPSLGSAILFGVIGVAFLVADYFLIRYTIQTGRKE